MLQDGSLDLTTDDDMLKLLERASGPEGCAETCIGTVGVRSDYESQTLQALMDTKLWKALSAKKDDLVESAEIYIENRIERDTKLLASLGLFVWISRRARRLQVPCLRRLLGSCCWTSSQDGYQTVGIGELVARCSE
jgi:hypothetical protein